VPMKQEPCVGGGVEPFLFGGEDAGLMAAA